MLYPASLSVRLVHRHRARTVKNDKEERRNAERRKQPERLLAKETETGSGVFRALASPTVNLVYTMSAEVACCSGSAGLAKLSIRANVK